MDLTIQTLRAIAEQRELWAKAAKDKDMHGSSAEFELTARIARKCIELMEKKDAS